VVFSGGNFSFLGNITELQTLTEIQIFRNFSLFFLVKVASLFDIDSILQVYVFFSLSYRICLFVCFDFALIFLFLRISRLYTATLLMLKKSLLTEIHSLK
jgi:hypothetical protein